MKSPLSLKAQALDNDAPDHYQIDGKILPVENCSDRQRVTKMIAWIAAEGKRHLDADGAELITHKQHFLVQLLSEQRDSVGRRAPIVCCGELNRADDPTRKSVDVFEAAHVFAAGIGRTLDAVQVEAVNAAFADLARRRVIRRVITVVGIVAVVLALLIAFQTVWQKRFNGSADNQSIAEEQR